MARVVVGGARSAGLVGLAALAGCYNLKFYHPDALPVGETHVVWVHAFLWGTVTVGAVDLDAECPRGVRLLKTNRTAADFAASWLTLGLYTPMNVVVTCRG